MATKKANGNGSLTSLFESVEEKGFGEVTSDDLKQPRISIIQALSPQRQKTSPDYNPDAEEGDLYYSGTNTVVSGEEGIQFLPVFYNKTLVEWRLREKGGGLVTVHPADSDILNRSTRDSQGRMITPSGETQITTTANHYGYAMIDDAPQKCVISMTGSQLKHSRNWNTLIQGMKIKGEKGMFTPPAFANWYLLKTEVESNDRGSWYSYQITQYEQLKDADLFAEAKDFSAFCAGGGMEQLGNKAESAGQIEDNSKENLY